MPIDPDTHTLWYSFVFQGLILGDNGSRGEAIRVRVWGYRQGISFSGFQHGLKRRIKTGDEQQDIIVNSRVQNHRTYDPHTNTLWIGKMDHEYADEQHWDAERVIRYADHPTIVEYHRTAHPDPTRSFDSLYDFYDHIRYDRKTKKFRTPLP